MNRVAPNLNPARFASRLRKPEAYATGCRSVSVAPDSFTPQAGSGAGAEEAVVVLADFVGSADDLVYVIADGEETAA